MSEITELNRRMGVIETETQDQNLKLDSALELLGKINLALAGDGALGITGIVATAKSAHRRLDEEIKAREVFETTAVERMKAIEGAAIKERWMGRIGSGVVGAGIAGIGVWLKHKLGIGE